MATITNKKMIYQKLIVKAMIKYLSCLGYTIIQETSDNDYLLQDNWLFLLRKQILPNMKTLSSTQVLKF